LIYDFSNGGGVNLNGLAIGTGGVLYGTTNGGGCGTVFSLTPPTSQGTPWTATVLHTFTGGSDGCLPFGTLAIGEDRALYGTTYYDGAAGGGTVFAVKLPASPGGEWTEAVLYSFDPALSGNGASPAAGVTIGAGGVLYGTTSAVFQASATVFSLTPPASKGGAWTEAVLYIFPAGQPGAGVAIGSGGVLYGTTSNGGTSGNGTVFSLTPPSSPGGAWTEAVLYNFTGGSDGGQPYTSGVVFGSGGVLYGATLNGGTGTACFNNCGTVYALTPPTTAGAPWKEIVLHSFTGGSDGASPSRVLRSGHIGWNPRPAPSREYNGSVWSD